MKLSIYTDATGKKSYKLSDENGSRITSEQLVKHKIDRGEVTNAYIDDNGEIKIINSIADAFVKSESRLKIEAELSERLDGGKYEVVAVVKENNEISGYLIAKAGGGLGSSKRVSKSTAILYASIGALVNAHVEYKDKTERLVGNDISLDNLAVVSNGEPHKDKIKNSTKIANGIVYVNWQKVKDTREALSELEVTDRRSDISLGGFKYPRTTMLSRCKLSITLDNTRVDIAVINLQDVASDQTSTLILEAYFDEKKYRIECQGINFIDMNCYMVALAGFIGIQQLHRQAVLKDVVVTDEDNKMWRLYYKTATNVIEDTATKIDKGMIAGLKTMYSMAVSEISVKMSENDQIRLIRGLRIGRSALRISCDNCYYDMTELVLSGGDIKRMDFTIKSSTGEEYRYYFDGLDKNKFNIKNTILICAASISKMSEIKNISIRALERDSEFLVIFKSKIR